MDSGFFAQGKYLHVPWLKSYSLYKQHSNFLMIMPSTLLKVSHMSSFTGSVTYSTNVTAGVKVIYFCTECHSVWHYWDMFHSLLNSLITFSFERHVKRGIYRERQEHSGGVDLWQGSSLSPYCCDSWFGESVWWSRSPSKINQLFLISLQSYPENFISKSRSDCNFYNNRFNLFAELLNTK